MTQAEYTTAPEKGSLLGRAADSLTVFVLTKAFELMSGGREPDVAPSQSRSIGQIALSH